MGKSILLKVIDETFKEPRKEIWDYYMELKREWNDITLQQDINYMDIMSKLDEKELRKERYYKLREKNLKLIIEERKHKIIENAQKQQKYQDKQYYPTSYEIIE